MALINRIGLAFKTLPRRLEFRKLQSQVRPHTWARHNELVDWASELLVNLSGDNEPDYSKSESRVVREGNLARKQLLASFYHKYEAVNDERVLIHIPPREVSPAGYTLFQSFIEAF